MKSHHELTLEALKEYDLVKEFFKSKLQYDDFLTNKEIEKICDKLKELLPKKCGCFSKLNSKEIGQ